jgi:hypothetical protein
MGIVSISALALAYTAATVPMWVISSLVGVMILIIVWSAHSKNITCAVRHKAGILKAPPPES